MNEIFMKNMQPWQINELVEFTFWFQKLLSSKQCMFMFPVLCKLLKP